MPFDTIFTDMANGFFSGRNGSDQLSVFLTAVALVLAAAASVISEESARAAVTAVAAALVAVAAFRMLSMNTAKRRAENEKFLSFLRSFSSTSEEKARKKARKEDLKTHAYFRCPECGTECRVPRGKGKIRITCPRCSHQFIKRT